MPSRFALFVGLFSGSGRQHSGGPEPRISYRCVGPVEAMKFDGAD